MWLEKLKALKKEKGLSSKQIAEKSGIPEKTASRIFSPYLDTLHRIVKVLGGSLDDILADTNAVIGDTKPTPLSETASTASVELDSSEQKTPASRQRSHPTGVGFVD